MTDKIEFFPTAKPSPGEVTPRSLDAHRIIESQPQAVEDPEMDVQESKLQTGEVINLPDRNK